jgi:hypothetical protein
MRTIKAMLGIATGMALLLVAASASAAPTCVVKAGLGTGSSKDDAKFQAWEAVLQATDWGSWASFMAGPAKIGTAPGYKVSNVQSRCSPGGLGYNCKMQARLCK